MGLGRAISVSAVALNGGPSAPALKRLRKGLSRLEDWAESNCLAYKAIIVAVAAHLDSVLAATPAGLPTPAPPAPTTPPAASSEQPPSAPPVAAGKGRTARAQRPPLVLGNSEPDRIHVDIVSPMTPGDREDEGNCRLM